MERMCWVGLTRKAWTVTAVNGGEEPKHVTTRCLWVIIHWVTLACI